MSVASAWLAPDDVLRCREQDVGIRPFGYRTGITVTISLWLVTTVIGAVAKPRRRAERNRQALASAAARADRRAPKAMGSGMWPGRKRVGRDTVGGA